MNILLDGHKGCVLVRVPAIRYVSRYRGNRRTDCDTIGMMIYLKPDLESNPEPSVGEIRKVLPPDGVTKVKECSSAGGPQVSLVSGSLCAASLSAVCLRNAVLIMEGD